GDAEAAGGDRGRTRSPPVPARGREGGRRGSASPRPAGGALRGRERHALGRGRPRGPPPLPRRAGRPALRSRVPRGRVSARLAGAAVCALLLVGGRTRAEDEGKFGPGVRYRNKAAEFEIALKGSGT